MANFWYSINKQAEVLEEKTDIAELNLVNLLDLSDAEKERKEVQCRECKSFLGLLYFDGPAPTHLRYVINGASMLFIEKPWFEDPNTIRQRREVAR